MRKPGEPRLHDVLFDAARHRVPGLIDRSAEEQPSSLRPAIPREPTAQQAVITRLPR